MTIKYRITKYPEFPINFNPDEDDYDASYDQDFDMYNDAETQLLKDIAKIEAARHPKRQEFQIKKIYIANPDAQ